MDLNELENKANTICHADDNIGVVFLSSMDRALVNNHRIMNYKMI